MSRPVGAAILLAVVGATSGIEAIEVISPAPGARVRVLRPTFRVTGAVPEGLRREQVHFVLDGIDVSEFARWDASAARLVAPMALAPGEHAFELRSPTGESLASLRFHTEAPGREALADLHYADASTLELLSDDPDSLTLASHLDGVLAGTAGELRLDGTWAPRVRLQGPQEDLVVPAAVLRFESGRADGALGTLGEASAVAGWSWLGPKVHREAVEARLATSLLGRFFLYTNLGDGLPGAAGEDAGGQWIHGLAWSAPLPGTRTSFTLAAQFVQDREREPEDGADRAPASDEAWVYGARLRAELGAGVIGEAELAHSDRERDGEGDHAGREESGEAVRVALRREGPGGRVEASWSRADAGFRNLADPGLRSDREEWAIELARKAGAWNGQLRAATTRDGLAGKGPGARENRVGGKLGARLPGALESRFEVDLQGARDADRSRRQNKQALRLARSFSTLRAELGLSRTATGTSQAEHDVVARSARASLRWTPRPPWSVAAGGTLERREQGERETRAASLQVEPTWRAPGERWIAALTLSRSGRQAPGGIDRDEWSARGTLGWKPPPLAFATIGLELGHIRREDHLRGEHEDDWRAAIKLVASPDLRW